MASPDPAKVLPVLFPPGQARAAQAYAIGILRYPGFYQPSRATIAAQGVAVQQWMEGKDAAGRQLGRLRLPALVADGTLDQLDPVPNDRLLAGSAPGAKLLLYPGAGHALLVPGLGELPACRATIPGLNGPASRGEQLARTWHPGLHYYWNLLEIMGGCSIAVVRAD